MDSDPNNPRSRQPASAAGRSEHDAKGGPSFATASAISLPKGGGALRGIGEKFATNPVTGTAGMTVPILTSPSRFGFGPQLSLAYDSGAGNSPFGLGWSLSLPSITRRTDKGLPQYRDEEESDTFMLSSAEDLVPAYRRDAAGNLLRDGQGNLVPDQDLRDGYRIRRYRPRIEGAFARIERWTRVSDGDAHWRATTRDNITTSYGRTAASRIADPADPRRVFTWLICESYDERGDAFVCEYQAEDSQRIFEDAQNRPVTLPHEQNRSDAMRAANRYIKRIKYGNRTPNRNGNGNATDPTLITDWMFEVVFDYDDGHYQILPDDNQGNHYRAATLAPGAHWPARRDPFSS